MTVEADLPYDPSTPTYNHPGLTAEMFADIFRPAGTLLNVGAGDTDLGADLRQRGIAADVVSLDPLYAGRDVQRPDFVAGYAHDIPFERYHFDMTTAQFVLQHIPKDALGEVIREMVRVTKTADSPNDATKGLILLNPVFKPKRLHKALIEAGVEETAFLFNHDESSFPIRYRTIINPTLVIHNTPQLDADTLDAIVTAVVSSEALSPSHRSLAQIAFQKWTGRGRRTA